MFVSSVAEEASMKAQVRFWCDPARAAGPRPREPVGFWTQFGLKPGGSSGPQGWPCSISGLSQIAVSGGRRDDGTVIHWSNLKDGPRRRLGTLASVRNPAEVGIGDGRFEQPL